MSGELAPNSVRRLVNQILYGLDRLPTFPDGTVRACADSILDRRHFAHPPEQYAEAIALTVRERRLPRRAPS